MSIRSALVARFAIGLALFTFIGNLPAAAQPRLITEDFQSDPVQRGWHLFGDSSLFVWDAEQENLRATFDSSRSNTFLWIPLGLPLSRLDDFGASLDLTLEEIAPAATEGKPGALQLAFGFQNSADAQQPGFVRGTGTDSPNLVEFNFFPDTGFGPTVWPTAVSTNSSFNYNGPEDFSNFDLPVGVTMRIALEYSASNETVTVSVTTNGVLAGPITSAKLSTNSSAFSQPFTDFHVDAFALPSYSDLGQVGDFAGSLFAKGVVDNIELRLPPLPVQDLRVSLKSEAAEISFSTLTTYSYTLEFTTDFDSWSEAGSPTAGTGERLTLSDPRGAAGHRFYRVAARRN